MTSRCAVTTSLHQGVLTVTVSNPGRRNALTLQAYTELGDIFAAITGETGRSPQVVVLTGADGTFAAGTDIAEFTDFISGEDGVGYEHHIERTLSTLLSVPVPVIAQVSGAAAGGGLALAACCDIVVADETATFGAPIVRTLGNCLSGAVIRRLYSRLGAARSAWMLLTGSMLTAHQAMAAGLVSQVVASDSLTAHVQALTQRLLGSAPLSLQALKHVMHSIEDGVPASDFDAVIARTYASADFHEGVAAFVGKRRPVWTGQ